LAAKPEKIQSNKSNRLRLENKQTIESLSDMIILIFPVRFVKPLHIAYPGFNQDKSNGLTHRPKFAKE